jgi:hypothetical protein
MADLSCRAVKGVAVRPLAAWDCGFESLWRHGYLSPVSVMYFEAEVSATDPSLLQRSPTECGVPECDHKTSKVKRPMPTRIDKP